MSSSPGIKLIIAGSRTLKPSFGFIDGAIRMLNLDTIVEVVSGAARGVDAEGEHWASHRNVPIKRFPADWDRIGTAAGPIRNRKMAEYADVLLLIWDGESRGSTSMRNEMLRVGKPVVEVVLKGGKLDALGVKVNE